MTLLFLNFRYAFFLFAFFNGIVGFAQQANEVLNPVAFSKMISDLPAPVIIDVRTPEEFQSGHIKDAINVNWKDTDFEDHINLINKSRPVLVYCLSGGRSGAAAEKMRKDGFIKVYELEGGMLNWRSENLPESENKSGDGISIEKYRNITSSNKWVLIDFYADWCAPCKKMEPYLEKIKKDKEPGLKLIRLNADENRTISQSLEIRALPVLKLYKSGELVWDHTGYLSESILSGKLHEYGL